MQIDSLLFEAERREVRVSKERNRIEYDAICMYMRMSYVNRGDIRKVYGFLDQASLLLDDATHGCRDVSRMSLSRVVVYW
jgi:hypothetical protein